MNRVIVLHVIKPENQWIIQILGVHWAMGLWQKATGTAVFPVTVKIIVYAVTTKRNREATGETGKQIIVPAVIITGPLFRKTNVPSATKR